MSEVKRNTFEILNAINVNDKTKTKMGLTYLSWSEAWNVLKTNFPEAFYTVYSRKVKTVETKTINDTISNSVTTIVSESENEVPYFSDGNSCYVKVGVTIDGVEYVELYPIMNLKNAAIPASMVSMTDVNKSIQRAFVKACARHGLALYVYSGEDLPDAEKKTIDFGAISAAASTKKVEPLNAEQFEALRGAIIGKLQAAWDPKISEQIMNYAESVLNGNRISVLAYTPENVEILCRINYFISAIESELK